MKRTLLYIVALVALISCQKDPDVVLTTVDVSNEVFTSSYNAALVQCDVTSSNSRIDVSVLYSPSADMANAQEVAMEKEGEHCEAILTGLQAETTYYVRYKVSNKISSLMAKQTNEFKTLTPSIPEVRLLSITNVLDSSAVAEISLITDGGAEVNKYGICWSTGETPTKEDAHCESPTLQLSYSLSSLLPNTKYYVRAYAINKKGIAYSEAKSLLTYALPDVETKAITNIQKTGCQLNGEVTFNGNDANYVEGFCWSTKSQPTLSDNCTTIAEPDAIFSHNLTNLKTETTYYVRAFAKNKIGLVYGNELTFTTKAADKPTVTTSNVTNITATSATCGGNVTDNGGVGLTERGICYATTSNPTISNTKVIASGTSTGTFSCSMSSLTNSTTYYVRAYAINSKGTSYGDVKSFTTTKPTSGTEAGHEWVDLGLSVKWATMNVGATTVTGYGNYYAWGETNTKTDYSWSTYKYCNGSSTTMTKYCVSSSYGIVDNKTTLEASDDAAHVNWGGNWRMPTHAEQQELYDNCTITWTSDYQGTGVAGRIFTSKKTGYTDKSIFLPAAGYRYDTSLYSAGSNGYYWSSSLDESSSDYAWELYFYSGSVRTGIDGRRCGLSVRAVCP